MKIVSNSEFEALTSKCAPRLRAMAKSRNRNDPAGQLTASDLDAYMEACMYAGDHKSVQWLKNLKHLSKSGMLRQLRQGKSNWNNHALHIEALHRKGEIKFKLGDAVMVKETGKQGQIIDYFPDEKEFLVVLDPFQIKTIKPGDLEKVARTKSAQFEDDEEFESEEPQEDDAFLEPSGPLGSRTSVSVGGEHLGEFGSDEEALQALKVWMEKNSFYPNVWQVSDHGNVAPMNIE